MTESLFQNQEFIITNKSSEPLIIVALLPNEREVLSYIINEDPKVFFKLEPKERKEVFFKSHIGRYFEIWKDYENKNASPAQNLISSIKLEEFLLAEEYLIKCFTDPQSNNKIKVSLEELRPITWQRDQSENLELIDKNDLLAHLCLATSYIVLLCIR